MLERERERLANDRDYEHEELSATYAQRGLDPSRLAGGSATVVF
jgi:hypothetical protein